MYIDTNTLCQVRSLIEIHEKQVLRLAESLPNYHEGDRWLGYYFYPGRYGLVVEHGHKVIAYTTWSYYSNFIMWDETVVSKDYQGKSIGKRLMHLRDTFTPNPVFGSCHEDNDAMVHILKKMGFHKCQVIPNGKRTPMILFTRGFSHVHK